MTREGFLKQSAKAVASSQIPTTSGRDTVMPSGKKPPKSSGCADRETEAQRVACVQLRPPLQDDFILAGVPSTPEVPVRDSLCASLLKQGQLWKLSALASFN